MTKTSSRDKILAKAKVMFAKHGYDAVSVADIQQAAEVARGTIYHHFASKEDILDALIEQLHDKMMADISRIASSDMPVIEKFINVILAMRVNDTTDRATLSEIHKPNNSLMREKIQDSIVHDVVPVIAGIVSEGVSQGFFTTKTPIETVEMLVVYAGYAFDERAVDEDPNKARRRESAFVSNAELLLGVKSGSLLSVIFNDKGMD